MCLKTYRLFCASIVSPLVVILPLSITYWLKTGSIAWFFVFFFGGYLFFFLLGLPLIAMLVSKRTLLSCAIGGGCLAISPAVLLGAMSFFSTYKAIDYQFVVGWLLVFLLGALGGVLFWFMAFWIRSPRVGAATH